MERFPVPDILECMHFVISSNGENRRITRNYEFDLYLDGERDMILDGNPYHISAGDLVFRKPGQSIIGYGDYNMFLLTLDFSHTVDKTSKTFRSTSVPQQPLCNLDILDNIPSVFPPEHFQEIKRIYEQISKNFSASLDESELQNSYISEMLFLILADAYKHNQQKLKSNTKRNAYVTSACKYINLHYAEVLTVKEIANKLSVNENYLIRLFKKELHTTPNQYITEMRLLHAKTLLEQTDHSIQYVANICGFNTPSYFTKCFKKIYHTSPLNFRKKAQKTP